MFARLYTNSGDVKTAYSELSKVITGVITSPASLTSFNSSTSTIDSTQPSNWVEYTSVGSTNSVNAGTAIWFRQRNRAGRWKYACIYRTTSPVNTHKGLLRHYTEESPSVVASVAGVATNNSEAYGATTEYTVAAGPGYLIVTTRLTTAAHFTEAHMWLEYPETGNSSFLTLPNHVLYRHFTTGGSYATDATTDIAYSTGIVEVAKVGNAPVAVLNGGMSTPATMHGTMKPSYFTSLGNTLSGSSSFVSYPFFNLFYVSSYQGHLDCSNLTNVWGTGPTLAVPNPAAPSGMSLLTCATNAIEDLSANGFAITATGNTAVTSFSPSNPNVNWSCAFDGTGDYLSIANNAALNMESSNFTIEMWYYTPANITTSAALFSKRASISIYGGILLYFGSNNFPALLVTVNGGSWGINAASSTAINVGAWNHIALTRSGNTWTIWVNGQSGLSTTLAGTVPTNSAAFNIGAGGNDASSVINRSYISNFRIVKGTALYTGSFTVPSAPFSVVSPPAGTSLLTCMTSSLSDLSSNNFTLTPNGDTTPIAVSPFAVSGGWSNFFDGNSDYLSLPSNAAFSFGTGDFTVECWVNFSSLASAIVPIIQNDAVGSSTTDKWWIGYNANTLRFGQHGSGTGVTAAWTPTINVWYHVAATRASGTMRLFIDGVLSTTSVTLGATSWGQNGLTVGAISTPYWLKGYVSNLRVIKGTALYTSNFTPTTSNLPGALLTTAYGESVTINGTDYAFLKANSSLSYLVPKR